MSESEPLYVRVERACDALYRKRGRIIPEEMVKEAAKPRGICADLRDQFEWDDGVAGHLYRVDQARHLIRMVTYVPEGGGVPVRRYFDVHRLTDHTSYMPVQAVVETPDLLEQVLERAREDFEAFADRYAALGPTLEGVIDEIMTRRRVQEGSQGRGEARSPRSKVSGRA